MASKVLLSIVFGCRIKQIQQSGPSNKHGGGKRQPLTEVIKPAAFMA